MPVETPPPDPQFLPKAGKKQTAVHDPELKRLRAIAFLKERVAGKGYDEIAEKFDVHRNTVRNVLTYAKRANIIVEESDRILEDMVPLARAAILDALSPKADIDPLSKAQLGVKIFEGTGLLGNKGKPSGGNSDDDELMRSMNELRAQAQLLSETSEAEILDDRSPQRLLADGGLSGPAEASEEGSPKSTSVTPRLEEAGILDGPLAPPTTAAPNGEPDDESGIAEAL